MIYDICAMYLTGGCFVGLSTGGWYREKKKKKNPSLCGWYTNAVCHHPNVSLTFKSSKSAFLPTYLAIAVESLGGVRVCGGGGYSKTLPSRQADSGVSKNSKNCVDSFNMVQHPARQLCSATKSHVSSTHIALIHSSNQHHREV